MDPHAMPMRLRSLARRGAPGTPRISYASYSCLHRARMARLCSAFDVYDDEQAVYIWKHVLLQQTHAVRSLMRIAT